MRNLAQATPTTAVNARTSARTSTPSHAKQRARLLEALARVRLPAPLRASQPQGRGIHTPRVRIDAWTPRKRRGTTKTLRGFYGVLARKHEQGLMFAGLGEYELAELIAHESGLRVESHFGVSTALHWSEVAGDTLRIVHCGIGTDDGSAALVRAVTQLVMRVCKLPQHGTAADGFAKLMLQTANPHVYGAPSFAEVDHD